MSLNQFYFFCSKCSNSTVKFCWKLVQWNLWWLVHNRYNCLNICSSFCSGAATIAGADMFIRFGRIPLTCCRLGAHPNNPFVVRTGTVRFVCAQNIWWRSLSPLLFQTGYSHFITCKMHQSGTQTTSRCNRCIDILRQETNYAFIYEVTYEGLL